jgi:hypothetical protein
MDHVATDCVNMVVQVASGKSVIDTAPNSGGIRFCKSDGSGAQGFAG